MQSGFSSAEVTKRQALFRKASHPTQPLHNHNPPSNPQPHKRTCMPQRYYYLLLICAFVIDGDARQMPATIAPLPVTAERETARSCRPVAASLSPSSAQRPPAVGVAKTREELVAPRDTCADGLAGLPSSGARFDSAGCGVSGGGGATAGATDDGLAAAFIGVEVSESHITCGKILNRAVKVSFGGWMEWWWSCFRCVFDNRIRSRIGLHARQVHGFPAQKMIPKNCA